MSISVLDLAAVAVCRRELLNTLVSITKHLRKIHPSPQHVAACDEVLELLVEARAGHVETEDEPTTQTREPKPDRTAAGKLSGAGALIRRRSKRS